MNQDTDGPSLHIDSDWKAEAQAEKEKLAAAEADAQKQDTGGDGQPALPDASFKTIVGMLASQALMGLGTMADPEGRGVMIDLEGSRLAIDLLTVLIKKTEGNLEDDESADLVQVVAELQSRYVQVTQAVADQMAGGNPLGGGSPAGGPPPGPTDGGIHLA